MAAILAKKLGMTQVFQEDGSVARVTVLRGRTVPGDRDPHARARRLRGRPAGVRRRRKEKHLTKAELGHLKKADAPPMRHLVEFRDEAGELQVGETVTVESFDGRRAREGRPGPRRARAFRERSSATTSPAGRSPTARTTCARRARSAPRRRPRACSRASAGRGRWATSASRRRVSRSSRWTRRRTC